MADEQIGAQDAPTETPQSMDDFIGGIIDAPDDAPIEAAQNTPVSEAPEGDVADDDEIAAPETDSGDVGEDDEHGEPDEPATAGPLMSAKDREAFNKLSPEMQKWMTERERKIQADYTRTKQDLAKQRQPFEQLDRVLAPHRQKFAHMGATEAQVVGQLLSLAEHADRDFVGFVQEQARLRGLPLTAFTQPGQQADPQLIATQRELQGIKNHLSQQQQAEQQRQLQSVSSVIEGFVKEKAPDGSAAYPYYEELETDMIPIVASLRQSKPGLQHREYLALAYKAAMATNETVSAKAEADAKAKAEAARVAKAKIAAANAKKAQGTQVRTAGTLPPSAAKTRNIDDFIGALVDERMA